jgi:hypothetical protein
MRGDELAHGGNELGPTHCSTLSTMRGTIDDNEFHLWP